MSTVPGTDSWRDAGLVAPDDDAPKNLVEEGLAPPDVPSDADDVEEYSPRTPRPDLDGEADEADVVEQASVVPLDEGADADGD
ncbi:hypothetical protein EQW78_01150 [Oerskovia turbata]|uniref:Uncharacterized protein n=1 Tax=Oerskovia turbata TaxID=1713 RepID=A0A4Q1L247_9CELL|nr:hypothetical protein [Oerskovia turbata]RXR26284.1 hypothetical protein EQW73_08095 [Oerskovia turbata]RXR36786.1 hypothetical protein EQW78_01150 [Oerskovia turbata]